MSIQESMMLQELTRVARDLAGRVRALEQRSPSRDSWPADLLERLERLEGTAGQPPDGNAAYPVPEVLRRIEALEAVATAADSASGAGNESGNLTDIARRLEALEVAAIAAGIHSESVKEQQAAGGNPLGQRVEALERSLLQEQEQSRKGLARLEALEARRDPMSLRPNNAQRVAHGKALRAAIADILQSKPHATGPCVVEALRVSHAGKLPSLRTVRWHLAAIRGNGNTTADVRQYATQTVENCGT